MSKQLSINNCTIHDRTQVHICTVLYEIFRVHLGLMSVPRVRRSSFGTRAFSVAEPTVWNSLPDHLRDPAVDSKQFRSNLKTYLFAGHSKR